MTQPFNMLHYSRFLSYLSNDGKHSETIVINNGSTKNVIVDCNINFETGLFKINFNDEQIVDFETTLSNELFDNLKTYRKSEYKTAPISDWRVFVADIIDFINMKFKKQYPNTKIIVNTLL